MPLLLFLLGCAAVYVAVIEAAFSILLRLSLRLLAERNGRHEPIAEYLENPILLFVPVRLLLGLIYALATVLMASLTGVSSWTSLGLLLVSVALFLFVCEHLVPLFIVRRNPERVLELLLPSFRAVSGFLRPLAAGLVGLTEPQRERTSMPAAGDLPEAGTEPARANGEGRAEEQRDHREDRRLLQAIVGFRDALAREVMTPRPDVVAIHADATLDELRALFREQEYSRLPVYQENLDNIVGFVFVKDLVQLGDLPGDERPIARLLRPAYFVPETKRVPELLKELQGRQVQSAIVVDEYGGTAGLVTVEDLLEEIVGEIRDEYDVEIEPVVDEGNGAFVFSGKAGIDEVHDRLGVEIEREGFETVGGYLLARLGRVPAVGETFDIDDLAVEVLEAERRRVTRVRMRRQPVDVRGRGAFEQGHGG